MTNLWGGLDRGVNLSARRTFDIHSLVLFDLTRFVNIEKDSSRHSVVFILTDGQPNIIPPKVLPLISDGHVSC